MIDGMNTVSWDSFPELVEALPLVRIYNSAPVIAGICNALPQILLQYNHSSSYILHSKFPRWG